MLELPNLNKQDFKQIMSEAKKQLINLHPYWTDNTPHDPGITILELLAYLKVAQQEALNKIGEENKLRYLELLNITPRPAQCAYTEVVFMANENKEYLPKGTKLSAGNIIFETLERVSVSTNKLTAALVRGEEDVLFSLDSEADKHRDWYAFGKKPAIGNCFYLGFNDAFTIEEKIKLKFSLFEEYPVTRNTIAAGDAFYPLVGLKWEYYGEEGGVTGWHPLDVLEDTTYDLLFSSFLTFKIHGKQLPFSTLAERGFRGYSLRCTLVQGKYDVPPRIKDILINCVPVCQKNSLSESFTFSYQNMADDQMVMDSYLAYFGLVKAFIKENDYWVELNSETDFIIEKDAQTKLCKIKLLTAIPKGLEKKELSAVKVVAMENDFLAQSIIGSSTGFINQNFELKIKNIIKDEFIIMVGKTTGNKLIGWQNWHQVKTLNKAARHESCYELNPAPGQIMFGDNRRGAVPPIGADNLMITDCTVTEASGGNIHNAKINGFIAPEKNFSTIDVFQVTRAAGGQDGEGIAQAELRMFKELNTSYRAVNMEDFNKITSRAPGLMIKHVKVLPLYKPGLEGYPDKKADNCVTLVVEPYSGTGQGRLTAEYKKNIMAYVERFRLITTKVYVIEPAYVGLELYGEIVIKANYGNAARIIEEAVNKHIANIQQEQHWDVRLNHGDIYGAVDLLECVSHIRFLTIEPFGLRVTKTKKGDILIPADSRFYLKKADLTLINNG